MSEADSPLREVCARAQALYGALPQPPAGVIHVVSAVRRAPARFHVIKIQEGAPTSINDAFVLRFWRAHCDVVLTTGQILRAEPTLSYAPVGPLAPGLAQYRAQVLGKSRPLRCAILTRGADLPLEHPIFRDGGEVEVLVLTQPQHEVQLRRALGERAQVVGVSSLDARVALEFLARAGATTIGVEAGPSAVGALYVAPPPAVDHVMLSIFEGRIEQASVGGALPVDEALFEGFALVSDVARQEASGPWRFQHWQRSDSALRRLAGP